MEFTVDYASNMAVFQGNKPRVITIQSVEDLMDFVASVGKIIVYPNNSIVVYDDYME